MKPQTKNFLKQRFKSYYKSANPFLPPLFKRREWAFIQFDESFPDVIMRRHKSFGSLGELQDYFQGTAPAHAYYSVAHYERPDAPTMREKGWNGADLIFDIDADHIPNRPLNYAEMLEAAKKEAQKILDIILNDFGIEEENVQIVFSGGRGYHIHIRDPQVQPLGSPERREIIDYMTGTGLEIIRKKTVSGEVGSEKAEKRMIPSEYEGGWGAKVNQWIVKYLEEILVRGEISELTRYSGIGDKKAEKLLHLLQKEDVFEDIRNGNVDIIKGIPSSFWESLKNQAVEEIRGYPDEPVTADVKRLIRLPGSLHGGAGLRVTPLSLDGIDDFNPLYDAVVFSEKEIQIRGIRKMRTELKGERFIVEEGLTSMKEYAAIFFMCRGAAEYEP